MVLDCYIGCRTQCIRVLALISFCKEPWRNSRILFWARTHRLRPLDPAAGNMFRVPIVQGHGIQRSRKGFKQAEATFGIIGDVLLLLQVLTWSPEGLQ